MQLVVVSVALQVVDGLLPVRSQDVLILAIKALVDLIADRMLARYSATQIACSWTYVCPWSCIQLCWRIPLRGQLETSLAGSAMVVDACKNKPQRLRLDNRQVSTRSHEAGNADAMRLTVVATVAGVVDRLRPILLPRGWILGIHCTGGLRESVMTDSGESGLWRVAIVRRDGWVGVARVLHASEIFSNPAQ